MSRRKSFAVVSAVVVSAVVGFVGAAPVEAQAAPSTMNPLIVYVDANYSGASLAAPARVNTSYPNLGNFGMDNKVSSVRSYSDQPQAAYQTINYGGWKFNIPPRVNFPNLKGIQVELLVFSNDAFSSMVAYGA